jgi:hypothetical protein
MIEENSLETASIEISIYIHIFGYVEKTTKLPILTRSKRGDLYVRIKDFLFFNNTQIT